jgi:hypothetical protein
VPIPILLIGKLVATESASYYRYTYLGASSPMAKPNASNPLVWIDCEVRFPRTAFPLLPLFFK